MSALLEHVTKTVARIEKMRSDSVILKPELVRLVRTTRWEAVACGARSESRGERRRPTPWGSPCGNTTDARDVPMQLASARVQAERQQ